MKRNDMARRRFGRLAVPGLAFLIVIGGAGVPAEAAASAGTTWATVMRRKLTLETQTAQLTAKLPGLRAAVPVRSAEITKAKKAQSATATAVTRATTARRSAIAKHATAKATVVAAQKTLRAAKKQKPYRAGRVTKAQKALTAAYTARQAVAATAGRTNTALRAAQTAHAAATRQVTAATTAHQAAVKAVSNAQAAITAWPKTRAALTAQTTALSGDVVTQARARFTMANTTKVYGVTVNRVVAYSFQRMIDDAAKAGISLSGGGFRTKEQQIALRKSNGCPDVWKAPSSSCRVPTAIPGRSLHELGLAVDMRAGGKSINSRKSKAFKWMAANAGKYGFVNLPSEPWHWSINGS